MQAGLARVVRILGIGFMKRSAAPVRLAATTGIPPMNVSSVPSPTPVTPVQTSNPTPPPAKTDSNSVDPSTDQPTPPAPLPPGQGTRVDQLA
jgi:hypothetical protein